MQSPKHTIMVRPNAQGWTWELIDRDGATTAEGIAAHQEGAMGSVWRAAKSSSNAAPGEFPEIVLGHPDKPRQLLRL